MCNRFYISQIIYGRLNVIIYCTIGAHRHGKYVVNGLNAVDKNM